MRTRTTLFALCAGLLALTLTTWNLGQRYLWQDEAACALLGERLFEYGAPLGWADGVLITMDTTLAADFASLDERTQDAESAVRYYTERGDFKEDTTWIGQPWGSMALAGLSLELFGRSTLAARLPFALCGVATVLGLFYLVRRHTQRDRTALLAALLLCANVFWLLHVRQCRYYAPGTALLVASLAAYLRWCDGRRFGAGLFLLTALAWFHVDFGSTVPGLGLLAVHALYFAPRGRRAALGLVGLLAVLLVPSALFYELLGRHKPADADLLARLGGLIFYTNRYLIALPVLILAGVFLVPHVQRKTRGSRPPEAAETRLVALAFAMLVGQITWMFAVAPDAFFRYIVGTAPLSALLCVWAAERVTAAIPVRPALAATALVVVQGLTPWAGLPAEALMPDSAKGMPAPGAGLRDELTGALAAELRGDGIDPNRAAVEYLEARLVPGDEVLVNYEDLPLAFYLDAPVRGGIACFRVEDPTPPRFCLLRRSAGFVPGNPYNRTVDRWRWEERHWNAPDIAWGNNPDPRFHWEGLEAGSRPILLLERVP